MTEWTPEQQKEHRRVWVEALRSGGYKQARAVLRDKRGGMCCLGVACELSGIVAWRSLAVEGEARPYGFEPTIKGTARGRFYAPGEVRDWLGLSFADGMFGPADARSSLADLNDEGKSFAEIADIIESEPEGLIAKAAA